MKSSAVKILIVDDRPSNRLALRAVLEGPSYELLEAESGEQALRLLLVHEFAALLVDVRMPGMDGFELAQLVRARERSQTTPILFVTAEAPETSSMLRGYSLGAVDYLVKPLIPEVVATKVAVFAELYRARQRIREQAAAVLAAEQQRAELDRLKAQMNAERHYQNLADAVPHIVFTTTPDGTVDYLNRRWFEITGQTSQRGADMLRMIHPDDVGSLREKWDAAMHRGEPFEFEARVRRSADWQYRWHLGRVLPERGPSNEVMSWLGTLTDIEQQKAALQILAEFKGTLDAVVDAVFIFDPLSWRVKYLNQGASALLGLSAEQLRQMRTLDLLPEMSEEQFEELSRRLKAGTPRSVAIETTVQGPISSVPVELSLQHIAVDGGRLVGIGRDISERKRSEAEREELYQRALEAIRLRDDFLSVASHELKTPLTSLRLHLDSIRMKLRSANAAELPLRFAEKLDVANRQIERLAMLIEELLDVSRIRTGRLKLELAYGVDLAAIVRDVAERHAAELEQHGCSVEVDAPEPVIGRWDASRLDQVVANLLTNAMKFGAGAAIQISVRKTGQGARLVVTDHGLGVPQHMHQRIFERFERAVSTRHFGGLGLGLYIVRQVVGAHHGNVWVESEGLPGRGASFIVELPVDAASLAQASDHV